MSDSLESFSDLGLNEWLVKQCSALGMRKPTKIQQHCTPEILKGEQYIISCVISSINGQIPDHVLFKLQCMVAFFHDVHKNCS